MESARWLVQQLRNESITSGLMARPKLALEPLEVEKFDD
jgi:hypothetical protein